MRTPLADLIDSYPDLGNRLSFIWGNLDGEDSSLPFEQRMKYANESEKLVTEIRKKPGISRFLLPREFSYLKRAAQFGPIVILNASQYRCDAFITLPQDSSPLVVSLHCSLEDLRTYRTQFREAVRHGIRSRREELENALRRRFPAFNLNQDSFRRTLQFLWSSVIEPCREILKEYHNSVSNFSIFLYSYLSHVEFC